MLTILFSALFAGLVATLVTIAIEKWGGIIGGVLGTVHTTIIPAAVGMYVAGDDLGIALSIVPLGMLLNGIFLLCWVIFPRKFNTSLLATTIISLTIWTIIGTLLVKVSESLLDIIKDWHLGLIGFIILAILGVIFNWKPRPSPVGNNKVPVKVLLVRGIAAAIAIGICVWLAGLGLPLLAGLASVFPAIFLTSMVALWISQGNDVPIGAAGPMMLGGASVSVYSLIAMWSLPSQGIIMGSILAWIGSVLLWSIPAYFWIKSRPQI